MHSLCFCRNCWLIFAYDFTFKSLTFVSFLLPWIYFSNNPFFSLVLTYCCILRSSNNQLALPLIISKCLFEIFNIYKFMQLECFHIYHLQRLQNLSLVQVLYKICPLNLSSSSIFLLHSSTASLHISSVWEPPQLIISHTCSHEQAGWFTDSAASICARKQANSGQKKQTLDMILLDRCDNGVILYVQSTWWKQIHYKTCIHWMCDSTWESEGKWLYSNVLCYSLMNILQEAFIWCIWYM